METAGMIETKLLQEVIEAVGGIKGVSDAVKVLKDLKDIFGKREGPDRSSPERQKMLELIAELSTQTVTAKLDAAAARADLLKLQSELDAIRQFKDGAEDYALVELRAGSFAYKKKGAAGGNAPTPSHCAHCFEQSQRVVTLQMKKPDFNVDTLHCTVCGSEVFQSNDERPRYISVKQERSIY
jgi:hypothetical protein